MSHMVIYRGVDGKPGYHQTDDIHDAVSFVEQMRNEEGVEHARIFRLEEVVFEYRPYYRVELTDSASPQAAISDGPAAAALPGPSEEVASVQVGSGVDVDADAEPENEEAADFLDDALEVVEGAETNGEVKADAGGAKKGLFGR
ncbi:MAG: hypothetical protein ACRBK7_15755 [Acidimicrobiales bacterium]